MVCPTDNAAEFATEARGLLPKAGRWRTASIYSLPESMSPAQLLQCVASAAGGSGEEWEMSGTRAYP